MAIRYNAYLHDPKGGREKDSIKNAGSIVSLREQIVRKWGSALKRGCYVEIIGGSRMWSVDYDPIKGRFTYTSNPEERIIVVQTLHSDGTLGGLIKRWRYRSWSIISS